MRSRPWNDPPWVETTLLLPTPRAERFVHLAELPQLLQQFTDLVEPAHRLRIIGAGGQTDPLPARQQGVPGLSREHDSLLSRGDRRVSPSASTPRSARTRGARVREVGASTAGLRFPSCSRLALVLPLHSAFVIEDVVYLQAGTTAAMPLLSLMRRRPSASRMSSVWEMWHQSTPSSQESTIRLRTVLDVERGVALPY